MYAIDFVSSDKQDNGRMRRMVKINSLNIENTNFKERLFSHVIKYRLYLILFVTFATSLTFVTSFFIKPLYKCSTILLPQSSDSKFGELAQLAGIRAGGTGDGDVDIQLYPTILTSETILKNILYDKFKINHKLQTLVEFWGLYNINKNIELELALEKLIKIIELSVDSRTNSIKVSIEFPDSAASALILSKIVDNLDSYLRQTRRTSASERRMWIESRLKEIKLQLDKSESELTKFKESNRILISSPLLQEEMVRLQREVEINSTIYIELAKNFELSKIEEIKNTPVVNILDPPRTPGFKSWPKKAILIMIAFIFSVLLGILGVITYGEYRTTILNSSNWILKFISRRK
ncbi:MAG: Wzz/FepE/Etk N-terminal domain-containing protein [Bacteroidetes bacterium]|nr:Wzz/FepE/Etk N-terminal domain-containing protein [Bacteroidota bacterium]